MATVIAGTVGALAIIVTPASANTFRVQVATYDSTAAAMSVMASQCADMTSGFTVQACTPPAVHPQSFFWEQMPSNVCGRVNNVPEECIRMRLLGNSSLCLDAATSNSYTVNVRVCDNNPNGFLMYLQSWIVRRDGNNIVRFQSNAVISNNPAYTRCLSRLGNTEPCQPSRTSVLWRFFSF